MGTDPLSIPGIPGSEPPASLPGPRRQTRLWVELVVAVVLIVALALLALGFVATAVGAHLHPGTSRLGQGIGAVIALGLLVLCTRWAIHTEHRLRGEQPAAKTWQEQLGQTSVYTAPVGGATAGAAAVAASPAPSPATPALTRRRSLGRRRRYGPVGTGVAAGIFVVLALGFAGGALSSHSQAVRSSYVQLHGTPVLATVNSVSNTQTCSKSSCNYTAAIGVTLDRSVQGRMTTTVHYPGYSNLYNGERVRVLVDPKQPDYAELPGARFEASWTWIVLAVLAVVFAALAWFEFRVLRQLLAHRREVRAQAAAGGQTAPA